MHELSILGEKRICVNNYNVLVKGRNLKRGNTILKHARFLHNLTVTPVLPKEEVKKDGEDSEGDEEAEAEWTINPCSRKVEYEFH